MQVLSGRWRIPRITLAEIFCAFLVKQIRSGGWWCLNFVRRQIAAHNVRGGADV